MVEAVLQDYRTAPIGAREKALFAFIEKMNRHSSVLRQEDVDEAKAAGWSDEAIYDAITVCALFNFSLRFFRRHTGRTPGTDHAVRAVRALTSKNRLRSLRSSTRRLSSRVCAGVSGGASSADWVSSTLLKCGGTTRRRIATTMPSSTS